MDSCLFIQHYLSCFIANFTNRLIITMPLDCGITEENIMTSYDVIQARDEQFQDTDFSNFVSDQLCEFILDNICNFCCCFLIVASADPVYNLLKGASLLSRKQGIGGDGDSSGVSSMRSLPRQNTASSGKSGSSRSSSPGNTNLYSFHFYPYSILGGSLLAER